jgi:ATP-binding cassette subfamily G (WHITE) protein 2
MSVNEKAPISNHGQVPHYGSPGAGNGGVSAVFSDRAGPNSVGPGKEQSLTFHQVGYEVPTHCGRRTKVIISSCSGIMQPGLNALMGPTGSGKTTLLDVLADRKGRRGPSGDVLINGSRRPKNFKCVSGYVVQDDLIMGSLSVRENLAFSAALRLPSGTTWSQRRERVDRVIQELGLVSCAGTKVGNEFFRGVSGGERKRTSIGMELIIQPQVLFLDEPTTGLDAFTAVSVVRLLKSLSETRIIILSIHQPRYSIFSLFSSLTLLSRGSMVYHGPAQQVLPYFESLGFPCAEHENPADFILDVLTTCEKKSVSNDTIVAMDTSLLGEEEREDGGGGSVDMVERYRKSDMCQRAEQELGEVWQRLEERGQGGRLPAAGYASNILWQTMVVMHRSIVGLLRDPLSLYFQIIIMVIFALIIGIVYFDLGGKKVPLESINNVVTDRLGAFFFMCLNQVFSNMSAVDLFIQRKALFIHENAGGYYRVSVFFFSQVVTDLIAKRIAPVLLFSVITYFMLDLDREPEKFFIFLLTLFLVSISAAAITYTFSSIANVTAVATLLSALAFVLSMVGQILMYHHLSSLSPSVSYLEGFSLL